MPEEMERIRCRYCGNEDRASEGYPCEACGAFICIVCSIRGITVCRSCEQNAGFPRPDEQKTSN